MLVTLALIIGLGIIMTLGASPAIAEHLGLGPFHFVKRQMLFLSVSLCAMFGISLLEPLWIRRFGVLLFLACLMLLVITLVVAPEAKGARRWIRIGSFTLQASEFMKPAFIIFCAWMFSETQKTPGFRGWSFSIIAYILVVILLIAQPDFGQTVLVTVVWGAQFFMAGLPMIWVTGIAGFSMAGIASAYMFIPHVTSRIDRFLFPESGDTYQIDTAINAFRSGGLFGRGPGEGAVKKILPDAHTDFIFAVTGEEFGLMLCLLIIGLFGLVVIRGLVNLFRERDLFIFLAVSGLFIQFGLQAFINLGVNLAMLPSKGMTLPFISYGGSSLLATSIGMGMILALTRRSANKNMDAGAASWGRA